MVDGVRRGTAILIGIGLVLIGLLGGILLTLTVGPDPTTPVLTRSVDSVELGGGERVRPTAVVRSDTLQPTEVSQLAALNDLFRRVADQVTPAVVYIQIETSASTREQFRFDGEMRDRFFRDPSPRRSVGSGVVVSTEGHIVTNRHVVDGADEIQVTLADKRQFEARVVGRDEATDLAVLKVDPTSDLPVVAFGDSDDVNVGEWVIAVGNPFRLTSTVTAGIVSALSREINISNNQLGIEDFIQTDAAINPGNSGGALVNLRGELVGISTAIATESGSYEGYGFAIPSNLMQRVVQDLIAYGEFRRAYLGITIEEVNAQVARNNGLEEIRGVFVRNVHPNGAAYQAGMRDGDIVVAVEGRPVNARNELQSLVARNRPGETITITVWRNETERTLSVELMGNTEWLGESAPTQEPDDAAREPFAPDAPDDALRELEAWGVGVRDLTRRERSAFSVSDGAYVAYVQGGSPAEEAGLPRDVVLTRVNGEAVPSAEAAIRALTQAQRGSEPYALLQVQRRDGTSAFYEAPVPILP
jgi:Do/DeqQ family serine protease